MTPSTTKAQARRVSGNRQATQLIFAEAMLQELGLRQRVA